MTVSPDVASAVNVGQFTTAYRNVGIQEVMDVAVNPTTNDTFVVGWTTTVPNASGPITNQDSNGQTVAFLSRIDLQGAVQWTKEIGKVGHDRWPEEMVMDANGDLYVILTSRARVAGSHTRVYVEKWSAAGIRAWQRVFASLDGDELGAGIDVSGSSVYVTFASTGSFRTAKGLNDVVISKLTTATGRIEATQQIGTARDDSPTGSVRVLADGSVIVAGYTKGALYTQRAVLRSDDDFFFARLDPSLGDVVSSRQWGSAGPDRILDTTPLAAGGMAFAGATGGLLAGTNPRGGVDGLVMKSAYNGVLAWTARVGSAADDFVIRVRQKAGSTNIDFAGETGGVVFGASADGSDIISGTASADGALLASKQFGTSGNDVVNGFALRRGGSPVYGGSTTGSFDSTPAQSSDGYVLSSGVDISGITQFVGTLSSIVSVKIPNLSPIVFAPAGESVQVDQSQMAAETPKLCNEVASPGKVFRKDVATCAGLVVKQGTKTYIRLSKKNAAGVCSLTKKRRLKTNAPGTCKVKIRATQRSGRTKAAWITYTIS